jgi:3-hydroxybutyryl-CoA dehydratase
MSDTPILPKRFLSKPTLGAQATFTRTMTEADAALFIGVTWDVNPLHSDESYCAGTPFKRRILPGLLTASLATHLGGLWAFLAREMRFEFLRPVYAGDTITTVGEVVEIHANGEVLLRMSMRNQTGNLVLTGEARGFPGRFAESE